MSGEPFISIRGMVEEIVKEIRDFRREFHQHILDEKAFRSGVVTKEELDAMDRLRLATRRYIMTSVIAIISVLVAAVGVILLWA